MPTRLESDSSEVQDMTQACSGAGGCPRVFVDAGGDVIVQGYEQGVAGMASPPAGEAHVRMDLMTWRELARQVEAAQADPFVAFADSAWRLETKPQYLVDVEAERFQAFREGLALPPWPAASVEWFAGIAAQVAAGRQWGRVHVVDEPLSDYTLFELECYRDNIAAGEDVRIAIRDARPELAGLAEDFWLFDVGTDRPLALLMKYDPDGRWLGYWRTEDPAVIGECKRQRGVALAAAVPLDAYLAASVGGR
jgi:hypothetical protein